jgi:hypothetical protein
MFMKRYFWNNFCDFDKILIHNMNEAHQDLSASALRHLLIEEIENFIRGLEHRSTVDLLTNKWRIKEVMDSLREKESKESAPLIWGKRSTEAAKVILTEPAGDSDSKNETESDMAELA